MTTFRFAHVADLHLDTPFSGLAMLNERLADQLQDASLNAWDRVVEGCIEHQVNFLVIAGDVYDSDTASVRAQLRFLKGLQRLSRSEIPCFIVHGNHDPNGGRWPAIETWPEGVTVFGTREVEHVQVLRDGQVLATVSGISYPERHVKENLARLFRREGQREGYHVAVLHCNVDGDGAHGVYAPCSLEDLRESRYDYWALGHIHARRVLNHHAPVVVYPGNTQARHPNETGRKGFAVVQVDQGAARLEWIDTDSWRFELLECPVNDFTSLGQLEAHLSAQAALVGQHHPLVVRARLTGSGALHTELNRAGVRGSLLSALRDQAGTNVWWDDVRVETRSTFDRADHQQGEDFIADLLRQVDRTDAQDLVASMLRELQDHPAMSSVLNQLDLGTLLADAPALLAEAEAVALDRLDGDRP